jgi:hypothetical protein
MLVDRERIDWKSLEYWLIPVNCSGVKSELVLEDVELLIEPSAFLIG